MALELFDTHCHLTFKDLWPRCEEIISVAVAAGVSRIITVTGGVDECEQALGLAARHPGVWVAAGIHPHEASRATDTELTRLATLWRAPRVVAAGEMGLDYHYDFSPRDVQRSVFRRQLDLAAEIGLPVIVHAREANEDVVSILAAHGFIGRPVVFHCFSGTAEQAAELRAHGWRTSFTGVVTFKNAAQTRRACAETPADEIMFETDAPYLSPEPVRKERPNQPKNLVHTVRLAANLRREPFEFLAQRSTTNAMRFFNLAAD